MQDNPFSFGNNLFHFPGQGDEFWQKLQQVYFNHNAISDVLAKRCQDDMQVFNAALAQNPGKLISLQWRWWQEQSQIYNNVMTRTLNKAIAPAQQPERGDRRFANALWNDQPQFDLLTQSYLLYSRTLMEMVDSVEGLPADAKERVSFFIRQAINACSPGNFFWSNPEIIQQTLNENGQNLVRGTQAYHDDVMKSGAALSVRMINSDAFKLGQDLAATPGGVVFENDIFQLIQYQAVTENVNKTPLLIIPPFINKYYVLDLREHNSLVNWLRQQGHTVFLMSWHNPDARQRDLTIDDLVIRGVLEACRMIENLTQEKKVNALGYCIGGTLLAISQAYCAGKKINNPINSATYLTTLLDFTHPGALGVFINEPVISAIEMTNDQLGYFDGRQLYVTFSLLKENALYWNYYINNYLKGQEPASFDILYWNSDSTNIAGKVHNFLLRDLYLNNRLAQTNGITINGVAIDLQRVKTPNFFVAAQEDHIALWPSCFAGASLLGGESTFVLGESGHVAGIVNPPGNKKYGYYINSQARLDDNSTWLASAQYHDESWWLCWQQWIGAQSTKSVAARAVGSEAYPVLEPAPGHYVRANLA